MVCIIQGQTVLNHSYLETPKRVLANNADPDQMPHDVVSDQGLNCLLTKFSIKIEQKRQNRSDTPKMTNGLLQHITVGESTSIQWFKVNIQPHQTVCF